jgi:hypothetical protein
MVLAWTSTEWTELLRAIAALAWPVLIGAMVFAFRAQLRSFIDRSEEIQTPVGTLRAPHFDPKAVEDVKRQLEVAAKDPTPDTEAQDTAERRPVAPANDPAAEILELATRDVRVAFLRLLDRLEARVRDLAATTGVDSHVESWQDLLTTLVEKGVVPAGVASNVTLLDHLRHSIVHGSKTNSEGEALTALDAGLDLLIALDGIPVQGYEVVEIGVKLFRDADCSEPWTDTSGVIVRQHKPRGRSGNNQGPFPTRREYQVGELVGWQWSFDEPPREFFWLTPDGDVNLIRSAWFVGERLRAGH